MPETKPLTERQKRKRLQAINIDQMFARLEDSREDIDRIDELTAQLSERDSTIDTLTRERDEARAAFGEFLSTVEPTTDL